MNPIKWIGIDTCSSGSSYSTTWTMSPSSSESSSSSSAWYLVNQTTIRSNPSRATLNSSQFNCSWLNRNLWPHPIQLDRIPPAPIEYWKQFWQNPINPSEPPHNSEGSLKDPRILGVILGMIFGTILNELWGILMIWIGYWLVSSSHSIQHSNRQILRSSTWNKGTIQSIKKKIIIIKK